MKNIALTLQEKELLEQYKENYFEEETSERNDEFLLAWKDVFKRVENGEPSADVLNATIAAGRPVSFREKDRVSLVCYSSFAGPIPVITIGNVADFEDFVTNVLSKGIRPKNISSTGASFAYGKNVRFIVLSTKPYSNVPASDLGLDEEEWLEKSMIIRREHECTHYYTKWKFGIAKNQLHDELMADFFGLYEAFGEYKAEYFLRFMGVIGTTGDRLKVYIPECSPALYQAMEQLTERTARYLERWSKTEAFQQMSREERVNYLCHLGLKEMEKGM